MILGRIIILLGVSSFLLTLTSNYFDITLHINGDLGVTQIGQLWFYFAPNSLQVAEAVVSRYIDPCSSLEVFNCSGFIWHPFISSILAFTCSTFFCYIKFFINKNRIKKILQKTSLTKNWTELKTNI